MWPLNFWAKTVNSDNPQSCVIKRRRLASEWWVVNLDLWICDCANARDLMSRVHLHNVLITHGQAVCRYVIKSVSSENREVTSHFYDSAAL